MRFAFAGVRVLAVLLALPAAGRAETAWLDAEVQAQEARWAAQRGQTAASAPIPPFSPPVARPVPFRSVSVPPAPAASSAPPPRARPAAAGDLARTLFASARRHGVDPLLVKAVILAESGGREKVRSPKGAMGLMQLMPATARRFGVTDPDDPAQNIAGGTRYLRWLLDRFGGDVARALAGYNAGEGAVDRHGGIPPYQETRNYVRRVQVTHAALGWILARKLARTGQPAGE